jgi:SNF2 family DNA or RNA helicase
MDEGHRIGNSTTALSAAVSRIKSSRRMLLSGGIFLNEYSEMLSYFILFGIPPFNGPEFFVPYFINVERKEKGNTTRIALLQGVRSAMLFLIIKSIYIRRTKQMLFEGEKILDIPQPKHVSVHMKPDAVGKCNFNAINKLCPDRQKPHELQIKSLEAFNGWLMGSASTGKLRRATLGLELYLTFFPKTEQDTMYPSRYIWNRPLKILKEEWNIKMGYGETVWARQLEGAMSAAHWLLPYAKYTSKDDVKPEKEPDKKYKSKVESRAGHAQQRAKFIEVVSEAENWKSTKIEKIVEIVRDRHTKSKGKVLIFCQCLKFLDVVKVTFDKNSLRCAEYNGEMTTNQKQKALEEFRDPNRGAPRIMLVTSDTGEEALNLQEATTIILPTPQWCSIRNEQSIGRGYRIGQKEQMVVYTFYMQESMDVAVMNLNDLKKRKDHNLHESVPVTGLPEGSGEDQKESLEAAEEIRGWS